MKQLAVTTVIATLGKDHTGVWDSVSMGNIERHMTKDDEIKHSLL
jgi:hypothetical protein